MDHSRTLSIRGEGPVTDEAIGVWSRGMKIPVLRTGELDSFLGPKEKRVRLSPSTDEAEQYKTFLRNQLDFEEWRVQQARA